MNLAIGILGLVIGLAASLVIARLFKPQGIAEGILMWFVSLTALVVLGGYLLSAVNHLASIVAWVLVFVVFLAGATVASILVNGAGIRSLVSAQSWRSIAHRISASVRSLWPRSRSDRLLISPPLVTAGALLVVSAVVVFLCAPHNHDSLSYHLARVAYYLQHGNMSFFDSNHAAQHPKNSAILMLFTYIATGRSENLTQGVQLFSYCVTAVAIYAIALQLSRNRLFSVLAGLIFALLPEALLQATTNQVDLIVTAYIAVAVACLLRYRTDGGGRRLVISGLALGLGGGTKATALLALPSVLLLAVYVFLSPAGRTGRARRFAIGASAWFVSGLAGVVIFALPSGYVENLRASGHPVAAQPVARAYLSGHREPGGTLLSGARNVLRYGVDFISLDGLYPVGPVRFVQRALKGTARSALEIAGARLESGSGLSGKGFRYSRPPRQNEDYSYWGILGFGLVLPTMIAALVFRRSRHVGGLLFGATAVFWLVQALAGIYDPWRGRYFITMAVFAVPAVASALSVSGSRILKFAASVVVLTGCVAALSTALLRQYRELVPLFGIRSILQYDRLGQMTWRGLCSSPQIRNFERLVPAHAVVAVHLPTDQWEYPLFGKGLTRTLLPTNSFIHGPRPIPAEAEYLLFSSRLLTPGPSDVSLGADWFLRTLKPGAARPSRDTGAVNRGPDSASPS